MGIKMGVLLKISKVLSRTTTRTPKLTDYSLFL